MGHRRHALSRQPFQAEPVEEFSVFYFAGRPVAQLKEVGGASEWTFLTTDHLGTPLLATDLAGLDVWAGPFEPFGEERWTPSFGQPSGVVKVDSGFMVQAACWG